MDFDGGAHFAVPRLRMLDRVSQLALVAASQAIAAAGVDFARERAERGELGDLEIDVPGVHYGIRRGDRVAMIGQHHEPGEQRVENGSLGEILEIRPGGEVLIEFDVTGQRRTLVGEDLARVRLGYAQHIHRAQGATVTRTLVVTGGWQTSKEPAYVEASRARQGTDWYVNRHELGEEGHDTERIERFAAKMRRSKRQTPSLEHRELPDLAPDITLGRGRRRVSREPGLLRDLPRPAEGTHGRER